MSCADVEQVFSAAAQAAIRMAGDVPVQQQFATVLRDILPMQIDDKLDLIGRCVRAILTQHSGGIAEADIAAIEAFIPVWRKFEHTDAVIELPEQGKKLRIWQGDITQLKCAAIVNAANSQMCGCFTPFHKCIDNVIHFYGGPRLRLECEAFMAGADPEPIGTCRITKAYLLPSEHVCHTVGPDLRDFGGHEQPELLRQCYKACLDAIKAQHIRSIAFCGISTGVFRYAKRPAAVVAVAAVREWLKEPANSDAVDFVCFNTFDAESTAIYAELLGDEATLESDTGTRADQSSSSRSND